MPLRRLQVGGIASEGGGADRNTSFSCRGVWLKTRRRHGCHGITPAHLWSCGEADCRFNVDSVDTAGLWSSVVSTKASIHRSMPTSSCTRTVAEMASPWPSGPKPSFVLPLTLMRSSVAAEARRDVRAHLRGGWADARSGAEDRAVEVDDLGSFSGHHGPEALEELDAAGVLVGGVVFGEVVAERADGEGAGERVDDRVGDDVSVRVGVEAVSKSGNSTPPRTVRKPGIQAVDVVAPADSDIGLTRQRRVAVPGRVWSAYRSFGREFADAAGC